MQSGVLIIGNVKFAEFTIIGKVGGYTHEAPSLNGTVVYANVTMGSIDKYAVERISDTMEAEAIKIQIHFIGIDDNAVIVGNTGKVSHYLI